jgi:hypothetical protein
VKISIREALEMQAAVIRLDGHESVLYKYDATTRLTLAKVRRELRVVVEDYNEARNKLIASINPDGIPPLNGHTMPQHVEFSKGEIELLKSEVEVNIESIDVDMLKLDDNQIPAGVLEGLGSLLKL